MLKVFCSAVVIHVAMLAMGFLLAAFTAVSPVELMIVAYFLLSLCFSMVARKNFSDRWKVTTNVAFAYWILLAIPMALGYITAVHWFIALGPVALAAMLGCLITSLFAKRKAS